MISVQELEQATLAAFPDGTTPPSVLRLLRPALEVQRGGDVRSLARAAGTTTARLTATARSADTVTALLGELPDFDQTTDSRIRRILGQLLIGALAEHVFVESWQTALGDDDLRLQDDRQSRGDTDFLVHDDRDRQVFRLNIKFHGSQFRKARELVGLEPSDCFALATYKIHAALLKQEAEHLPYIFVIVGVPGLSGEEVGAVFSDTVVRFVAAAHASKRLLGKRTVEDAVVNRTADSPATFGLAVEVATHLDSIRSAEWRVISARRADDLLKAKLFERAYALRVRGFASNYRGAELDMHFSISQDLHSLADLFGVLRDHGMPGLVSRLERGSL